MSICRLTGRGELNVKALLCAFNHKNALVGAFSVIVKLWPAAASSSTASDWS